LHRRQCAIRDQNHSEAPTPLRHIQNHVFYWAPTFARRVFVQFIEHNEDEWLGRLRLFLILEHGEYGFLPASTRLRASILKPGTMIVSQPEIPIPLLVQFPFPAWATRPSEAVTTMTAGSGIKDPFVPGKPRLWTDKQIFFPGTSNLALAPDGKRFAVFPMPEASGPDKGSVHVTFLLNFLDELRRRIPRNK
jgi:hypothetical protein